jgi:predicted flap endonuclease-1-like 5' DNA nuclease
VRARYRRDVLVDDDSVPQSELTPRIGKVAARELALHGYRRYDQLAGATASQLLAIHGVGPKAIRILRDELAAKGLAFAGDASTGQRHQR